MRARAWVCDAKTGAVRGELPLVGGSSWTSRLEGGSFSCEASLSHLMRRDESAPDWSAVSRMLGWLTVGRASLALTVGTGVVFEGLLMKRSRVAPDGTVSLSGIEWSGYPALRSLNRNYKYTDTEQLTIARDLLDHAFLSFNAGMQMGLPSGVSGVKRNMDHDSHDAYYSDLLEEIANADGGFEWFVDVSGTFAGEDLVSVQRQAVFGFPTLARPRTLALHQASPGFAHGNLVSLAGGEDFSRYAQSVYGIGEGSGKKRLWVGLSDPSGTNAGNVNKTLNISFPGIKDLATLTVRTKAALAAAQNLADPFEGTGWVDKMQALPAVGYQVTVSSDPSWAFPTGLGPTVLRVGEVTYRPVAGQVATVDFAAAE